MSNLKIKEPEDYKELNEYEYFFSSGISMPILFDPSAGDYVEDQGDAFVVHLTAKPSVTDPEVMLSPETIRIFKSQLAAIHEKTRRLRIATSEEKTTIKNLIKQMSNSVN